MKINVWFFVNFFSLLFWRLNDLVLSFPCEEFLTFFYFFDDFIYRCQKLVEEWIGALVFYATDVSEGKQWTSRWLVLFLIDPCFYLLFVLFLKLIVLTVGDHVFIAIGTSFDSGSEDLSSTSFAFRKEVDKWPKDSLSTRRYQMF